MLAGVSLDYYNRLERGNIPVRASDSVLNAIARALQLDNAEREHLFHLARRGTPRLPDILPTSHAGERTVRSSVQRVLDNMAVPAVVTNAQQDIIAANDPRPAAGHAPHFDVPGQPNMARFIFLDSRAPDFYADWPLARRMTAAMLRLEAGRDPLNEQLTALIGELSTRSPHFRAEVGRSTMCTSTAPDRKSSTTPRSVRSSSPSTPSISPASPGLSIVAYSAEPDTSDADRLALLASWAAN